MVDYFEYFFSLEQSKREKDDIEFIRADAYGDGIDGLPPNPLYSHLEDYKIEYSRGCKDALQPREKINFEEDWF